MLDIATLTDTEVDALLDQLREEKLSRRSLQEALGANPVLLTPYLESLGRHEGDDWVQPLGAHDAYPVDWQVQHNGKTWVSLIDNNVWEPGVSSWGEVTDGVTLPTWVQPTGAHDAYTEDAWVMHNGRVWLNKHPANVWEPGTVGAPWTDMGPIPGTEEPEDNNQGEN